MFADKTLWEILQIGGFTMVILLFCSFLSLMVTIERIIYYHGLSKVKRTDFIGRIKKAFSSNNIEMAIEIGKSTQTPFAAVACAGLEHNNQTEKEIFKAMERQITVETEKLERFTGIVGTIGNTAVYIGLLGTVLGIIKAFNDIAAAGSGGMSIVIEGVAEALICTATGLFVAIPSVIAYNYFTRRTERFGNDMELCASEMIDLIPHA
jgi:biopolymer transport protein ExbB/TolQ